MVDVDIMQEKQLNEKTLKVWSYTTFSSLMAYSPYQAAMFAIDCGIKTEIYGISVEDYVAAYDAKKLREENGEEVNVQQEQLDKEEAEKLAAKEKEEAEALELAEKARLENEELLANKDKVDEAPVTTETTTETTDETKEVASNEELSKEDLQELLKANNIDFPGNIGQKKLLELAKTNNLL